MVLSWLFFTGNIASTYLYAKSLDELNLIRLLYLRLNSVKNIDPDILALNLINPNIFHIKLGQVKKRVRFDNLLSTE